MIFETNYKNKTYTIDAYFDYSRNTTVFFIYLDGIEGIFNPIIGYSFEDLTQDRPALETAVKNTLLDYEILINCKSFNLKSAEILSKHSEELEKQTIDS